MSRFATKNPTDSISKNEIPPYWPQNWIVEIIEHSERGMMCSWNDEALSNSHTKLLFQEIQIYASTNYLEEGYTLEEIVSLNTAACISYCLITNEYLYGPNRDWYDARYYTTTYGDIVLSSSSRVHCIYDATSDHCYMQTGAPNVPCVGYKPSPYRMRNSVSYFATATWIANNGVSQERHAVKEEDTTDDPYKCLWNISHNTNYTHSAGDTAEPTKDTPPKFEESLSYPGDNQFSRRWISIEDDYVTCVGAWRPTTMGDTELTDIESWAGFSGALLEEYQVLKSWVVQCFLNRS